MKEKICYNIGVILLIVGFYGILFLIGKWIFTFGLFKLLIYVFSLLMIFGYSMVYVSLDDIKININTSESIIKKELKKLEHEFDFFSGREHGEYQDGEFDGEVCHDIALKIEVLKDLLKKIGE